MKPRIRVITFDLDDTFWDAKPVLINAEHAVFNWLKIHAPKVTDQFTFESLAKWRLKVYKNTPQLIHQVSQLRIVAIQQAMVFVGYEDSVATNLARESFDIFIKTRHEVTLFDEVLPMLKQLSHHYILGTLTNGNIDITKLSIGRLFEFSFRAEQLNASKPAPDLFIAAQQACACESSEIIHVGDHIVHDVYGAKQAGCHALWFNPNNVAHPKPQQTSMQVQSLADIPQAIYDFDQA